MRDLENCFKALAGLHAQKALYESSVRALSGAAVSTVVLVTRPEPPALAEAHRTAAGTLSPSR